MRELLREVAAVVGLAVVLGLAYNALGPQKLPLLRREQRLPVVEDTVLLRELQQAVQRSDTVGAAPRQETVADRAAGGGGAQQLREARADTSQKASAEPVVKAVRYEQLVQLLAHPEVLLLDARRPEDYAAGHIPGARNVFAYDFAAHIPELITLPRDKLVVIYCDGGQCELSHYLAEQLRALGFQRLYIYEGGWEEWQRRHNQ